MNKVERIVDDLSREILSGALPPGRRLPSIRRAAEDFDVSKNTIVEAYDRLNAQGLLHAVHGSGFYVADHDEDREDTGHQPQHVVEAFDRVSLLSAQLSQDLPVRVGDGRPPYSWMQDALPQKLTGNFLRRFEGDQTAYGNEFGNQQLREVIAQKYRRDGMPVATDQVVTTFGANHALDLIIRRYLEPGDTVLVDDPGYYPLFAKLKFSKIDMVGVPRTPNGPDVDCLRDLAKRVKPKLFFTQSRCQNPTGSSMNLPTAHEVLQIAVQFGIMIVDNEPFVDLPGQDGYRLAGLDQFKQVIAVSTYSKLLSASFRVGYLIGPPQIAKDLAELKLITSVNSSRFSEMLIADMISNRRYQRHLRKMATRLQQQRLEFNTRLADLGLSVSDPNGGGYYAFLTLPASADEAQVARQAIAKGIFMAPGKFFRVDEQVHTPAFRINMTRVDNPRFYSFLAHLSAEMGAKP